MRELTNTLHTRRRWSATLGKFVAVSEGEEGPVWVQPQFSYAFTGQPPLEAYEEIQLEFDFVDEEIPF